MDTTRCGDSMFAGLLEDDTSCELPSGHPGSHQATVQIPAWMQGGTGDSLVDTVATWESGDAPSLPGVVHHTIPRSSCANCRWEANRVSGPVGTPCPTPGDVSFCEACGAILVFEADLSRRAVTAADMATWAPEDLTRVLSDQKAVIEAILARHPTVTSADA